MIENGKTVFVGLSGGVDSSVAAARLKTRGFNVVGVFIKVWHPEFLTCNWEAERLDAMRVAAHLDIPFLMCDAEEVYKNEVADYFISEYTAGRTPNPDVMCNKSVKFGAFLKFALERGADYIATGHYAQKISSAGHDQKEESTGAVVYKLQRGNDQNKDQSYFLWTLTQEQLKYILLPVGDSPKTVIRKEAEELEIPVATKKDSQGICFLGHIDVPDFLSHYIDLKQGEVLGEDGTVIGKHQGAFVYTLGQRHGFTIENKTIQQIPHYVVDKNIDKNTITVSTKPPLISQDKNIQLSELNLIGYTPKIGDQLQLQTRYRQNPVEAEVYSVGDQQLTLKVHTDHEQPTPGQSCVLYDASHCLGGGIIA